MLGFPCFRLEHPALWLWFHHAAETLSVETPLCLCAELHWGPGRGEVFPLDPLQQLGKLGTALSFSHSLLTVLYPVASEWSPRLTHVAAGSGNLESPTLVSVGPSLPSPSWSISKAGDLAANTSSVTPLAPHLLCPGVHPSPSLGPLALGVWLHHPPGWWRVVCLSTAHPTLPLETGLRHTFQHPPS